MLRTRAGIALVVLMGMGEAVAQSGGAFSAEGAPSDIITIDGTDVLPVLVGIGDGLYALVSFRIPPTPRPLAEAAALCVPPLRLRFTYHVESTAEGGVYVLDEAACASATSESPLPAAPPDPWRPPVPQLLLAGPTFALVGVDPFRVPSNSGVIEWQLQQRSSGTWTTIDAWEDEASEESFAEYLADSTSRFEFSARCAGSRALYPDVTAPGVSIRSTRDGEGVDPEFSFRTRVRMWTEDGRGGRSRSVLVSDLAHLVCATR